MAERSHSLLAEHLERGWPLIRAFLAERNWPDTKLGNAAAMINEDVAEIIAALRGGWTPVAERLPDDDMTVMIATRDESEPVWIGFHDEHGWHSADATPLGAFVTHWKMIPEGPNG